MYKVTIINFIDDGFLDTFERFQETTHIHYVDSNGVLSVKEEHYVDEWDVSKKEQVVQILRYYLDTEGAVVPLVHEESLLGFAAIKGKPIGSAHQYLNLGFIHISNLHRGNGLGKILFTEICKEAKH